MTDSSPTAQFREHPGLLFVAATLLPLRLVRPDPAGVGGVGAAAPATATTARGVERLYNLFGGDKRGRTRRLRRHRPPSVSPSSSA